MITNQRAQDLCNQHWPYRESALYQFAIDGSYSIQNHLRYLQEIETLLHPEYKLYPTILSQKAAAELNRLKNFFINAGLKYSIGTEFVEQPVYGYLIPYLTENTPAQIEKLVIPLYYMK